MLEHFRSLDVLDEVTGSAFHSLVLLNPKGDVVFKETADDGSSVV